MKGNNKNRINYRSKIMVVRIFILLLILGYIAFTNPEQFTSEVQKLSVNINNKLYKADNQININNKTNESGNITNQNKVIAIKSSRNTNEFTYLSDIPYMKEISYTTYDKIRLDKNLNDGLISVIIDGKKKYFLKGVFAHANATIAYDLREYDYDYLTAYLGIDSSVGGNGNGVRFEVHTSEDGVNWNSNILRVNNNATFKGNQESYFLKYPIKGIKYIKFVVQDNGGNNSSDHAVIANAKLIKEGYEEDVNATVDYIKTVAEYDAIIKNFDTINLNEEQELTLLQREFVSKAGYDLLQTLVTGSQDYADVISWLMNDIENLRLYILGGTPDGGSYSSSLYQLNRLYKAYKNDFLDNTLTRNPWYPTLTKGDVYKKMVMSLALTHSTAVGYWAQINHPSNRSDAVERYAIFKDLYDRGKFVVSIRQDQTPWFEALHVEEMRYVMNSIVDNEEILWFNEYTQKRIDAHPGKEEVYLQPHTYIAYVWPNFNNPIYHDPANYEYFDELFEGIFSKYGVTYSTPGDKVYKAWMSMRNKWGTGAVCGGISKLGTHIRAAHGTPASVISQPGHAAIIYYRKNAQGKGYWTIDNNISGWAQSGKTERLGIRMPNGWGNDSYVSGWAASYIILSQEALNDPVNYEKSEKLIMLANLYNDDKAKKEDILREALKVQPINIDAWWGLIQLYKSDSTKTEEQYYRLAVEMGDALLPFPLPLYNLMNQIKGKFTSAEYQFKFNILQSKQLVEEKNYNSTSVVLQPAITRTVGSYLLGQTNTSLATFSFDGAKAGKIVLDSRFNGSGIRWDYSLDGKETWKEVSFTAEEAHELQLSEEEIDSITSSNDIYIHIVGVNYNEENLYKIDIQESAGVPSSLYANDLENKIIGATSSMEWRLVGEDNWNSFTPENSIFNGDKEIEVKVKATGTRLASSSRKYNFTEDNQPLTEKYVPISRLSLVSVSSQQNNSDQKGANALDGNINTMWHSRWDGNDSARSITIMLDEPIYLSALEYYPRQDSGNNGNVRSAKISVSMDGQNWTDVVTSTNWANNKSPKKVQTVIKRRAKYVRLSANSNYGDGRNFIAASMINLFEDTTLSYIPVFSFDGEDAGKIVFEGDNVEELVWQYSLDGGENWNNANGSNHQLSPEEINNITPNNGIKVKTDLNKEYDITIFASTPPARAVLNDFENRLIAVSNVNALEWKLSTDSEWTLYTEKEPIVEGDKILYIRKKASGISLASDIIEYQFTEDNQPSSRKYISIKHLSVHGYTSQSADTGRPFYAPNAIDGNVNTIWHTDFRYDVRQQENFPYYSVKLDTPKYISGIDFLQKKYKAGNPDSIKNGIVYVSVDGETWVEAGRIENCAQDETLKSITFEESIYGQYVKFEMETYNMFTSLAMLNIYEDETKKAPTVTIDYNKTSPTNQPVIATVVSDKEVTITNNNGSKEYTFTENGSFTFEYEDMDGNSGTVVAVVDNIDTKAPIGTISYNTKDVTNSNVIATLTTDKEVTITNNNGSKEYTFTENGEFTFEFVDEAGNTGSETAFVSWINKNAPVGTVTYDIKTKTNQDVTATIDIAPDVNVTNNNGSKEYTFTENGTFVFELLDDLGNRGTVTAEVNWIDKDSPVGEISYNITEKTYENVTAILTSNEKITITNNNGSKEYTFTKNGTFTFEFVDEAGNTGTKTAEVSWIMCKELTGELVYSTEERTNQNVTVTLEVAANVEIKNNNGSNEYIFTENGEFTFEIEDYCGNKAFIKAEVSWIDKEAPIGEISYSLTTNTNGNVIATLTTNENVTITNNNGSNEYIFTENGSFTFEFIDEAGNTGTKTAEVSWINKDAPVGEISYDIENLTNKDVIATVSVGEGVIITNNDGSNTYTFTENGTFVFEFTDEAGNTGSVAAIVNWIDKDAPVGEISYNLTTTTNGNVIATLTTNENVIITNNNGSKEYTFTENGEFTFEFVDEAGNIGTITATVNWITKEIVEEPKSGVSYEPVYPIDYGYTYENNYSSSVNANEDTDSNKETNDIKQDDKDENKEEDKEITVIKDKDNKVIKSKIDFKIISVSVLALVSVCITILVILKRRKKH